MGMGFPKRPFPHNNKYQQRYGETEQIKAFKYDYLEGHKHLTLSSMLSVLLEEFLRDKYLRYGVVIETNIKSLESVCVCVCGWVGVEVGWGEKG